MEKKIDPKICDFSTFLLLKDHIQEKFHHYFHHFLIKHYLNKFSVKFENFLTHVTQKKWENIKSTNLLYKMHYSWTRPVLLLDSSKKRPL